MKILLRIVLTIFLPLIWYFDPERFRFYTWRDVGMDIREPIKFGKTFKLIWNI